MKIIALLYHDVVERNDYRTSGFEGGDADIYKFPRAEFERHLDAIARAARSSPTTIRQALSAADSKPRLVLTFDDGGASAHSVIADLIEARGWHGHFLITTDRIGTPAFLTAPQIRDLHARGHVLGSHSCSHPQRISHLPFAAIQDEWKRSVDRLADILGSAVEIASVPNGFYTRPVARAAAEAGVRILFNSEPVLSVSDVESCRIIGRFGLQRGDTERTAASFAAAEPLPRLARWSFWNMKKMIKAAGGDAWLAWRKRMLAN